MNLTISGHHVNVTQALREYVEQKLQRVLCHFDQVVDTRVLLSLNKAKEKEKSQKVECTIHVKGQDLFAESMHADMYAAIDNLVDKMDRQVMRHKGKLKKGYQHIGVKHIAA